MHNLILVLNCGSSSMKAAVLDGITGESHLNVLAEKLGSADALMTTKTQGDKDVFYFKEHTTHDHAVRKLLSILQQHGLSEAIIAVGHRVVHGGEKFHASTLITREVLEDIEHCIPLAPLHNPAHLLGIHAAQQAFPDLPHVAVFDTSFHQTMPEHAYMYAIPRKYYRQNAVRRYGFHGTSYRYVSQTAAKMLKRKPEELCMVIAHLGNGASVTAVKNGLSVDTSMGLTPLEGLIMGTRSGDIDPSIFEFLFDNKHMSIRQINSMLNKDSGLLGISELSNDCRTLEEHAALGHDGAILALNMFAYRLAKYIASMTVATGRLDALVFTGGIGENSVSMRQRVMQHLGFLGVHVDDEANQAMVGGQAGAINAASDTVLTLVIPTNEELMIAQDTYALTTA